MEPGARMLLLFWTPWPASIQTECDPLRTLGGWVKGPQRQGAEGQGQSAGSQRKRGWELGMDGEGGGGRPFENGE